jgi:uncharacterized protein YdeI (YjbR/CyaY-like superfamily)
MQLKHSRFHPIWQRRWRVDRLQARIFEASPRSVKRGILERISDAKTSATREKRIVETATLAVENRRANQWRK